MIKNDSRLQRIRRHLEWTVQDGYSTPGDQDHDHHRGYDHDLQSALAGLVNTLRILPPEVNSDQDSDRGGESIIRKML